MIMKEWLELWGYNWICIGAPQACKRFGKCHISIRFSFYHVLHIFFSMDEGSAYLRQAKLKNGWPDLKQVPVVSWPPEKPGS